MFKHIVLLLFLLPLVALFLGCSADEELISGEEVVVKKWIDPVDIGKDYVVNFDSIGNMGGTFRLDTGETVTVTKDGNFALRKVEDGIQVISNVRVKRDGYTETETHVEGSIVLEGPPIVTLYSDFPDTRMEAGFLLPTKTKQPVTRDNNVKDYVNFSFSVEIDRVLDYNLPIYLEYQERNAFTEEVRRGRFFLLVPKGEKYAWGLIPTDATTKTVGNNRTDDMASISILPHTEMNEVELPLTLENVSLKLPLEDRTIPKGHTFRPYRIRSSSFLMGVTSLEGDW